MGLDHSKATATITLEGLLVFVVNDQKQCELAFLSCDNHELNIDVRVILPNGFELPIKHSLDPKKDLAISVVNPDGTGISFFKDGVFDRKKGQGDAEDFRWVIDLEGPEFHNKALEAIPAPSSVVGAKLTPKLFITDGQVYASDLPNEQLARKEIDTVAGPVFLGRAADIIGVDIACLDGGNSSVIISNEGLTGSHVKLPKVEGVRYRIQFVNDCDIQTAEPGSTDFSLYYDVLRDPTDPTLKFDLRSTVAKDHPSATGEPFPDSPLLAPDGSPQRCGGTFCGQTKKIF